VRDSSGEAYYVQGFVSPVSSMAAAFFAWFFILDGEGRVGLQKLVWMASVWFVMN
jgi:hypothetical protein